MMTSPIVLSRHNLTRCVRRFLFLLAALSVPGASVLAQGVLVDVSGERRVRLPRPVIIVPPQPRPRPIPPGSYKIESLEINARLQDQIAQVQVAQSFVNTGSRQMEVCFVFPLPYDGAVDRLTLMVDGKEFEAKLMSADEARRTYESIVRKNKDPALLEWIGTGMFKTSVFPVPAGAKRTVTLRYSQLLRKTQGITDFLFPLSTAKYTSHPLEKLRIRVAIDSKAELKNVYSPTHEISLDRPDNRHAVVTLERDNVIPSDDFRLLFDTGDQQVAASVISYRANNSEPGYFLLLATPQIPKDEDDVTKKNVIFVVDRSGSMSGKKMEQAREALQFVLNNLRDGDLFNIIAYDSEVEAFRPELQRYNEDNRQAAVGFVNGLYAGGSTNIHAALNTALSQMRDSKRPNYVIFLTDGLPTVGTTNESQIVQDATKANEVNARLFAFGVGYDVNSRLLDKLTRNNTGQSHYVRPNEDIENAVSTLYNRIGLPVMTDVSIEFDVEGASLSDGPSVVQVYPSDRIDLFAGDQLIVAGRYTKPGAAKVIVAGAVGDGEQRFDFPAELVQHSEDASNAFVARLWSMRRIGEILDELDLKGHNDELVKELVALATKHGVLTRYTSFLADESAPLTDLASNASEARRRVRDVFDRADGAYGFGGRAEKGALRRARLAAPDRYSGGYDRQAHAQSAQAGAAGGGVGGRGRGGYGPGVAYYDAVENKPVHVDSVRNLAGKTFFKRADRWVESTLKKEEIEKAIDITRFSDAYFDLAKTQGKQAGQILAADDTFVVRLGDRVYVLK